VSRLRAGRRGPHVRSPDRRRPGGEGGIRTRGGSSPHRFSRAAPSTTRTPLRARVYRPSRGPTELGGGSSHPRYNGRRSDRLVGRGRRTGNAVDGVNSSRGFESLSLRQALSHNRFGREVHGSGHTEWRTLRGSFDGSPTATRRSGLTSRWGSRRMGSGSQTREPRRRSGRSTALRTPSTDTTSPQTRSSSPRRGRPPSDR
jgi:hypothetical protein